MRIVIRSEDSRRAREVNAKLEAAGLAATALVGAAAFRPAPAGEDVTLLDALDPQETMAAAARLRAGNTTSLALLGLAARAAPPPAGTEELFDGWLPLDAAPAAIRRRVDSAFRRGAFEAEISERTRTARALSLPPPDAISDPSPHRVLFVGKPAPLFLALESALARAGSETRAAASAFCAFDYIHDGGFDALALAAGEDPTQAMSLLGALRRNSGLIDLPAYLIADGESVREAGLARGADEAVAPDADMEALSLWLSHDIAQGRRQRALARGLEAPPVRPEEAFAFFAFHVAGLAQSHQDRGRPLSLAVLGVEGGRDTDNEHWRRGFGEIARLSARLVRACDSTAVIDPIRIAFAFPSTSLPGAESALARVISVCECTAFSAGDHGGPPLSFRARACELSPGESGAGLLARALDIVSA